MIPTNSRYGVWAGNPKGNPEDKTRCQEQVHEPGRSGLHYQCQRPWKIERDGHRYCKQHDPEAVRAKREEWERKYRENRAAEDRKWRRREAEADLVEAALAWYHGGPPEPLKAACAALELLR